MEIISALHLQNQNRMSTVISADIWDMAVSYTHLDGICDGMKVAYDRKSLDQSRITDNIVKGKEITLIPIRTQQTIGALMDGTIDAGVWNYDDVLENHHDRLKVVSLPESDYNNSFSTAVLVIKTGDEALKALLKKYISVERVLGILSEVREKRREPFF